jgi:hypothetical protein
LDDPGQGIREIEAAFKVCGAATGKVYEEVQITDLRIEWNGASVSSSLTPSGSNATGM